jgi:(p)ppGpp synthase/HD superfamily hydrolase
MAERIRRTAREIGIPKHGVDLLAMVHERAMDPRLATISDDHDPAYLHPGRTAAILMDDLAMVDADWIAAAMLVDTGRPDLEATGDALRELPDLVIERSRAVPRPGSETLVEDLLALEPVALNVALAERLDQLRHIHLWDDSERAAQVYRHAVETYSVIAVRGHPKLVRRYAWWTRTFGRKFPT